MKFILIFLLAVLLSKCCLSKIIGSSHQNSHADIHNIPMNSSQIENSGNQSPFSKLNFDELYLFLRLMELQQILNLAEADPELVDMISEYYQRIYEDFEIHIYHHRFDPRSDITVNDKDIRIFNPILSLRMIKRFGHLFRKISVKNINDIDSYVTNQLINQYCSKRLTHFRFFINGNTFEQFTVPLYYKNYMLKYFCRKSKVVIYH